jgi:hypothetical protein
MRSRSWGLRCGPLGPHPRATALAPSPGLVLARAADAALDPDVRDYRIRLFRRWIRYGREAHEASRAGSAPEAWPWPPRSASPSANGAIATIARFVACGPVFPRGDRSFRSDRSRVFLKVVRRHAFTSAPHRARQTPVQRRPAHR